MRYHAQVDGDDDLDDDALGARYFVPLAAAFVRGRLGDPTLADLAAMRAGRAAGLRLHKFKRNGELPRVKRVLGALRGLAPASLLDVGSGRGTFLWPLLDAFPDLPVTAIDHDARRASDLFCVHAGGVERLSAERQDATKTTFADGAFDVVTMLEVLEHFPDPAAGAREAVRVATRNVVVTVPSKEDDNPEHLHLFDAATLDALFTRAGARRVVCEHVLNHIVAFVHK